MLTFPNIDPVIFQIGFIQLRWYSLMYIIGLVTVYYFFRYSSQKTKTLDLSTPQIDSVLFYGLVGMILGARLTYVFVYNFDHYINHPSEILATWKGGLSFHGALFGICIAIVVFCKVHKKSFFNITDHMAVAAPVGLGFGRIGNFINSELWGRVTDAPIGMIFPDGGPLPRHPSQLYESFFEGFVLLIIMFIAFKKRPKLGVLSAIFMFGYSTFRFFIEFFREPDSQLGTVFGPFSMGQLLCAIMFMVGVVVIVWSLNRTNEPTSAA